MEYPDESLKNSGGGIIKDRNVREPSGCLHEAFVDIVIKGYAEVEQRIFKRFQMLEVKYFGEDDQSTRTVYKFKVNLNIRLIKS